MKHQLLLATFVLVAFFLAVEPAALDVGSSDIDFYKILNNPDARVSLKDRITTVSILYLCTIDLQFDSSMLFP